MNGKSVFRIILGTFVTWLMFAVAGFLIFWAYDIMMSGGNGVAINWIFTTIVIILLYLFSYGWIGTWMLEFSDYSVNKIWGILGKILGTIGLVLRPFVILAYGGNKKWILLITTALPMTIMGIVLLLMGFTVLPGIPWDWQGFCIAIGVLAFVTAFFVLAIKKCPSCKCVMSKTDLDIYGKCDEEYSRTNAEQVGYISDEDGNTAKVYQNMTHVYSGERNFCAKYYECENCGLEKQGMKFSVLMKK